MYSSKVMANVWKRMFENLSGLFMVSDLDGPMISFFDIPHDYLYQIHHRVIFKDNRVVLAIAYALI
jgi:hypothetical protein